jgi:hypothetical protein
MLIFKFLFVKRPYVSFTTTKNILLERTKFRNQECSQIFERILCIYLLNLCLYVVLCGMCSLVSKQLGPAVCRVKSAGSRYHFPHYPLP